MLKDWVHLQAVVVLWALLVVIVPLIFHSVPQPPVKMAAPVLKDWVHLQAVLVLRAFLGLTVPQPHNHAHQILVNTEEAAGSSVAGRCAPARSHTLARIAIY